MSFDEASEAPPRRRACSGGTSGAAGGDAMGKLRSGVATCLRDMGGVVAHTAHSLHLCVKELEVSTRL